MAMSDHPAARDPFGPLSPIDFVDIGCSGGLDPKWADLFPLIAFTGFDPNGEECERLAGAPHPYRSARYLPYAIAGERGVAQLFLTESPWCHSLLRPNHPWLDRFTLAGLFRETGSASVACTTLDALAAEQGLRADIVKLDTQGMELPILRAGGALLDGCTCVETETGFMENYVGETTYAQIDEFMRGRGFMMYDLTIHRVGRANAMEAHGTHQPMWCQAVWMYDFVGRGPLPGAAQALKAFRIARALGYYDYGLELARRCREAGVLDAAAAAPFEEPASWLCAPPPPRRGPTSRTGKLMRFVPEPIRRRLLYGLKELAE